MIGTPSGCGRQASSEGTRPEKNRARWLSLRNGAPRGRTCELLDVTERPESSLLVLGGQPQNFFWWSVAVDQNLAIRAKFTDCVPVGRIAGFEEVALLALVACRSVGQRDDGAEHVSLRLGQLESIGGCIELPGKTPMSLV